MNAQPRGFWWGFFLGGAGTGSIAGLIPLFLGVLTDQTWLAIGGFLACIAAGTGTGMGLFGALLAAGIFRHEFGRLVAVLIAMRGAHP
jgi:hypothetical protein